MKAAPLITALLLWAGTSLACSGEEPAAIPTPGASARAPESAPASGGDLLTPPTHLEGLTLKQVREAMAGEDGQRRAMIKRLLGAAVADAPDLHRWLHRQVDTPVADMKNLLRSIGAAVPDSRGRFGAAGAAKVKDLDWLEALLTLPPAKVSEALRPALAECLLTVTLLRATASSGHPDAAVSLVRFGYRHRGAFRDECGNQIRTMGLEAVPGLVRVRNLKDELAFKMERYASYQLDRMNCTRPDRVLKLAGPDLKAELLHAYGEVRHTSAVGAVLDQTADPVVKVRRAARWATLRYVSGRPPRAKKRKLKLVGGRKTVRARTIYYTYQQLATHALAGRLGKELARVRGKSADAMTRRLLAEVEPRQLAERLFAVQDKKLEAGRARELEQALALARSGKLPGALARFDLILAASPYHPRRHEMAPFFLRRAEDLLAGGKAADRKKALLLLTKAVHLAPAGEAVEKIRAMRLVAEALDQPEGSPLRVTRLGHALALAPGHPRATPALEQEQGRLRSRLYLAGGVGLGLAALLLFGLLAMSRLRVLD